MNEPIRVVRGQPSEEELAALAVVLLILRGEHPPADDSARESPAPWTLGAAYEAPGAWSGGNTQAGVSHTGGTYDVVRD
jgi:hypothetical protein